jgi:small subunit ribosomal protein S4
MGDPKRHRKKFETPGHPWQRVRIDEERTLVEEYGFKNKREIWKMNSVLRDATAQAKKLITLTGPQADKEKELLLARLRRYGLLKMDATVDAILSITPRDVLERRFQTIVYKKGFSSTVKQARQFITHGHVTIAGKVVTSPSYLVPLSEEGQIGFKATSSLSDLEHPERTAAKAAKENPKKKVEEKKEDSYDRERKGGPGNRGQKRDFRPRRREEAKPAAGPNKVAK